MSKWQPLLGLILLLFLTSCSRDVWCENIKSEDFAPLDTILSITTRAAAIIILGYFLLSKCVIPYFAPTRSRSHHLWRWVENHLTDLFYIAWAFGFITYFVGSYVGDTTWAGFMSMLSSAPMAAVYATGMFRSKRHKCCVWSYAQQSNIHGYVWFEPSVCSVGESLFCIQAHGLPYHRQISFGNRIGQTEQIQKHICFLGAMMRQSS